MPNHGLAHYCLALIAQDKKAPRGEVVKHLQASAKGDPLSLPVWTALATQYQQANDTANTLVAFKQMLRVAPTNQKLREELFKYFLQCGHPETALEVADEGLKIDPYNADLYDLKSNACLFLSNFKCAVDALETMYATDSTKADTLFFTKISAAAAEGEKPDTLRLLKWAQIGVTKYPDNPTLLGYLNRGYSMTGQTDSVVAVTNRIIAKDTTAMVPALEAAQALINAPPPGPRRRRHRVDDTRDSARRATRPTPGREVRQCRRSAPRKRCPSSSSPSSTATRRPRRTPRHCSTPPARSCCSSPRICRARRSCCGSPTSRPIRPARWDLRPAICSAWRRCSRCRRSIPRRRSRSPATSPSRWRRCSTKPRPASPQGRAVNQEAVDKNLGIIKQYKPRAASMVKAYCK